MSSPVFNLSIEFLISKIFFLISRTSRRELRERLYVCLYKYLCGSETEQHQTNAAFQESSTTAKE